jgi:hypothetical protein
MYARISSAVMLSEASCLTDAPLPFFVRVGLPICVGIIFATRAGATQFGTRGHVLAYNLTRVIHIVGAQPLMAAMRA